MCGDLGAQFRSWTDGVGGFHGYAAGEIETLRILDVNGTIIVINAILDPAYRDATAIAELAAVLDSIRIERT